MGKKYLIIDETRWVSLNLYLFILILVCLDREEVFFWHLRSENRNVQFSRMEGKESSSSKCVQCQLLILFDIVKDLSENSRSAVKISLLKIYVAL